MKTLRPIFFLFLLYIPATVLVAQTDTSVPSRNALAYADSLLNAFRNQHVARYVELSNPGMIKYYGGKKNFENYIVRARQMEPAASGQSELTQLVQMVNNGNEWQCVIRKTNHATIDSKKALVISYLVGQSTDNGAHWKFVDVAFNSVSNIVYIMPDVFDTLTIPQRQIIFESTSVAHQ